MAGPRRMRPARPDLCVSRWPFERRLQTLTERKGTRLKESFSSGPVPSTWRCVPEDDDLLAGVASGDPDWGGIYHAYSKDVYAAAQKILGSNRRVVDSKDVEDIVQLTFEESMKEGVLTPETRSIAATLRKVATRRAIDAARRGAKIHETDVAELADEALSADDGVDEFVQDDFELEIQRAIWRNQRTLTAQERTIFRSRAVDGKTFVEIGSRLQLTPQRIGQIYGEAINKIKKGIDLTGDGGDLR